jgi:hypothetical protein
MEVLVSVMLLAMLSTAVLSALRSGFLVRDKTTKRLEALRRSRTVFDLLDDQIRGAVPLVYTSRIGPNPIDLPAFDGDRQTLRFVTRTSFKDGPDAVPRWVQIQWQQASEKADGDLNLEEHRILPPDNQPDRALIWGGSVFRGSSCAFEFLSGARGAEPGRWLPEWHFGPRGVLPKAVRLTCTAGGRIIRTLAALDLADAAAGGLTLR